MGSWVRLLRNFAVSSNRADHSPAQILRHLSIMEVELCLCRGKSERWSLNDIDDFPQVLLLLLNFKIFMKFMSWLSARYTYSLQCQMNKINNFYVLSIEFLEILNYQIIRYNRGLRNNENPAITNIFSVPWHFVIAGCHFNLLYLFTRFETPHLTIRYKLLF